MANGLGGGLKGKGRNLKVAFEQSQNEMIQKFEELARSAKSNMGKVSDAIKEVGIEAENTQGKVKNLGLIVRDSFPQNAGDGASDTAKATKELGNSSEVAAGQVEKLTQAEKKLRKGRKRKSKDTAKDDET